MNTIGGSALEHRHTHTDESTVKALHEQTKSEVILFLGAIQTQDGVSRSATIAELQCCHTEQQKGL